MWNTRPLNTKDARLITTARHKSSEYKKLFGCPEDWSCDPTVSDLALGSRFQSGTISCAVFWTGPSLTEASSECVSIAKYRSAGLVKYCSGRQTAKATCRCRWPTTIGMVMCRRSSLGWA